MKPRSLSRLFRDSLARHSMVRPDDRVLVAVSGGPDSMALLDLFAREAAGLRCTLGVAHLDHGMRGDASREDRAFVERAASGLGLECRSHASDVPALALRENRSPEDAARLARRRFLEEAADSWGATRIALGHHRGDRAEWMLLRLMEGTGTAGLAGMRPVSGRYIRPLLDASREEILAHLAGSGVAFREDASNDSLRHPRNRIRRELLPAIEGAFNPRVTEALCRAAEILGAEEEFLQATTVAWLDRHDPGEAVLPRAEFLLLHPAIRRRVLVEALVRRGGQRRRIRFDQIEEAIRCIDLAPASGGVDFADGLRIRASGGWVKIVGPNEEDRHEGSIGSRENRPLPVPGETSFEPAGLRLVSSLLAPSCLGESLTRGSSGTAHLDFERTGSYLMVRSRRPGDRFHPLGAPGSKSVGDFLTDAHVPIETRNSLALVVSAGENPGEVIWIAGVRISEQFKVTASTRTILRIEAHPQDAPS